MRILLHACRFMLRARAHQPGAAKEEKRLKMRERKREKSSALEKGWGRYSWHFASLEFYPLEHSADGTQGASNSRNLGCTVLYVLRRRPVTEEEKHVAFEKANAVSQAASAQTRRASQPLCVLLMSKWDSREEELEWSTMSWYNLADSSYECFWWLVFLLSSGKHHQTQGEEYYAKLCSSDSTRHVVMLLIRSLGRLLIISEDEAWGFSIYDNSFDTYTPGKNK